MEAYDERQQEEAFEAPTLFRKIEELESFNVNKQDINKLKEAGFHTIEAVAHATLRKLTEVKGISEQKAQKLKETIKSEFRSAVSSFINYS